MLRAIRSLDYVVLLCRDPRAQKQFYNETLGFPVYRDWNDWIELQIGASLLALRPRDRPYDGPGCPGSASLQLAFRVAPDQVEPCYRELIARGVEMLEGVTDRPSGHRTIFFRDPEGNILEIYAELAAPDLDPEAATAALPTRAGGEA
jgi:lactoylglutathione lyase